VLEFVTDEHNGLVCEPTPLAIAEAMDRLFRDRGATESMGRNAQQRITDMGISWARVIEKLLS
jgi:glycosyltransferase involved in cell wall biosynthesis